MNKHLGLMEIKNNLQYLIAEELEIDITNLLEKLDKVSTICSETYNGLEEYRNVLHSKRQQYDYNRFPQNKTKNRKKL